MSESYYGIAKEQLSKYIVLNNLRNTHERYVVLKYICQYKKSFNADILIKALCQSENISRATVYNTLSLLLNAGIIEKSVSASQDNKNVYRISLHKDNVCRFICTKCGREVQFKSSSIDHILKERLYNNFDMNHYSVTIYGFCKKCRKSNNLNSK